MNISPADVDTVEKNCPMLAAAALFTGQQTTQNKPIRDKPSCSIIELAVATQS